MTTANQMSKELIPRKYNEQEQEFIRKYSESSFLIWETLSDSQKAEYFELEQLYADFFELFKDHYEDLKLYALMYRNVPLYGIGYDAYSILYFASRKNEIIGYKKRLSAVNSLKTQIVQLYCLNEAVFPKVCKKYVGVDFLFQKTETVYWLLSLNTLKEFKMGKIPHIFSINDLSEQQCSVVLKHKDKLLEEYKNLYNSDLCSYDFYPFRKYDFNEELLTKDLLAFLFAGSAFIQSRINRYLIKEHKYKTFWEDVKNIQTLAIKYLSTIEERIAEIANIIVSFSEKPEPYKALDVFRERLKKRHDISSVLSKRGYEDCLTHLGIHISSLLDELDKTIKALRDKERWQSERLESHQSAIVKLHNLEKGKIGWFPLDYSVESELKITKKDIDEAFSLKDDVISIKNDLANVSREIMQYVPTIRSCEILFSNYISVNAYVEKSFEKVYNLMWMYRPNTIKDLEAHTTRASSLRELIAPAHYRFPCPSIVWNVNKKTKKQQLTFSKRTLMQQWCYLIKAEIEKKEELERKEQEAKKRIEEERRKAEEERRRREEEARLEKYRYNKRNRHYRDSYISFDETNHTYTVDGKILQSVTNIVENCFPKFDAQLHAKATAAKMGMTEEEVIAMWERKGKESRELGTAMHQKIESYYQGKQPYEDDSFRLFKVFADKVKLEPYRTEWAVYDTDNNIAGTIDFVDYQDGKYTIYDWKRSDKIIANGMPVKFSKYQEKGLHPLEHLENCAYYHYALQLSLYKFILEKNYDIKVSDLRLGIFHPSYDKPYVLRMPYLENEVKTLMELRSEVVF